MKHIHDLVILGESTAALVLAQKAAARGIKTALVASNTPVFSASIPARAFMAAAKAAMSLKTARDYGIQGQEPVINYHLLRDHIIKEAAGHTPETRLEDLESVTVLRQKAKFTGPARLETESGDHIYGKHVVLATGARTKVSENLTVPVLTPETIFTLETMPHHLIVVGGGASALELAQAFYLFGSRITLLAPRKLLPSFDPALVDRLKAKIVGPEFRIFENTSLNSAAPHGDVEIFVSFTSGRDDHHARGTHLLIATSRPPVVEDLNLEAAGVTWSDKGIEVDTRLKTTGEFVYALGDCVSGPHGATPDAEAEVILSSLTGKSTLQYQPHLIPRAALTLPEIAQVGISQNFAQGEVVEEENTEGLARLWLDEKGAVGGAALLGTGAAEAIGFWQLAIGLTPEKLSALSAPSLSLLETSLDLARRSAEKKLNKGKSK